MLIVEKSNACLSRVYFDMLFNLGFLTYVGRYILYLNITVILYRLRPCACIYMLKGVLFIRWCSFSIVLQLSLVLFHFVSKFIYIILLVIFIPSMYISGAVVSRVFQYHLRQRSRCLYLSQTGRILE